MLIAIHEKKAVLPPSILFEQGGDSDIPTTLNRCYGWAWDCAEAIDQIAVKGQTVKCGFSGSVFQIA
jgi:hypothetical protein